MATVTEIAPDVFRLTAFNEAANFQFSSFLVKDDEPLLYHTNLRGFFPNIIDAASRVLDPATIRWIGFSHFESDECGSLNDWLAQAPHAEPVCSFVGARTSVGDFSDRPPRVLGADETLETGSHKYRLIETKHLPHCWDASMMFDEAGRTLFCSDLFGHGGDVAPLIHDGLIDLTTEYNKAQQQGPMSRSVPITAETRPILEGLADLAPTTLACMHGSSFSGDGGMALRDLADLFDENSKQGIQS